MDQKEKRRRSLSHNKFRIFRVSTEPPVPLDLSREITRLFDVNFQRKQRISEYMCESIRHTKRKAYNASGKELELGQKAATADELREYANKSTSTLMSRFQETDIKNKINGRGLEEKYPQLLKTIMDETKEKYLKITHHAGVNLKVKPSVEEECFIIKPFKYLGKTKNYQNYLDVKQRLFCKWILYKPIIQKLLMECVTNLPYEILNLNFDTVCEFDDFRDTLHEKVISGTHKIHEFYARIVNLIDQYNVTDYSYLGACSGLLSVHLSRTMAHTLLHIIDFTTNKDMRPYLILKIAFQQKLVIHPTSNDVIYSYKTLFKDICGIITGLRSFENKHKSLNICLTEEFLAQSLHQIEDNIKKDFDPIIKYLQEVDQEFSPIYFDICSVDLLKSLTDMTFEFASSKISYYKQFIDRVQYIPNYEYFPGGQLDLSSYRDTLYKSLKTINNTIFKKISSQHYYTVCDICESFQLIYMRALKNTETTEELIETGKFMARVKDEHFQSLTEKVHESIIMLAKIILLGILTKDHIKTSSMAVTWPKIIPPVIEQHTAVFEQLKFEAEEKLQKMIEDVNAAILEVFPSLTMLDDMDNICNAKQYLSSIIVYMTKIKSIEEQISWINQDEVCLSFPKSSYSEYQNLKNYVYPFYHLLKICLDIQRNLAVWQDGQFDKLNYESTNNLVDTYYTELISIQREYRKKLRQAQDDNLPVRFRGTVDDPDMLNWPAPLKLCFKAIQMIEDFKPSTRVMKIMCNNTLRKRHWQAMSEIAGFDMTPNAGTTLRKIMKYDLEDSLDKYEIISNGALKENLLLKNLEALYEEWSKILFKTTQYNGNIILVALNEILEIVDDHIIKVLTMRRSVFIQPYENQVNDFYKNLQKVYSVINQWGDFQDQWIKLSPIFCVKTVKDFLVEEFVVFKKLDGIFRNYMGIILEKFLVMEVICNTNILEDVENCLNELGMVNKGVTRYLEKIRNYFPRFYFLSDEDLVHLLSKTKNPAEVQGFLWKLFRAINKLNISQDDHVLGMLGQQSELITFRHKINIKESNGNLEIWLSESEQEMRETLRSMLIECRKYCKKDTFIELFDKWSQQILELHTQIVFTEAIDNALNLNNKIRLRLYLKKLITNINEKIEIINKSNQSTLQRVKLRNLIVTDINNKNIVGKLLQENVTDIDDFNWEVQLKYYQRSDYCFIRTMKCTINYLFEYQGNLNQIIITPLTDRCFRSLINSNCLHLNALIQGSAGTGKTETVKSLAKAFATLIITFNCSKCLNYQTVQRFLKGAAICGAWLCIKKINLVKSEILSIIYQDILTITSSIKSFSSSINIDGNILKLNSSCFVSMTTDKNKSMQSFPENFKLLFRCITVSKPDLKMISEVGLYSLGFLHAPKLSKKINMCFKILKDYLFSGKSQNFGLDYIKLLLKVCDEFKAKYPSQDESVIVENSITNIVSTRFSRTEVTILGNILKDLFANNSTPMKDNSNINEAILKAYEQLNLIPNNLLSLKVTEMWEYVNRKHGLIIIGEALSGKTTVVKTCSKILYAQCFIINPKTLQYHQMFGMFDPISNKWADGVLTKILRDIKEVNNTKWIVFEGNIDPSWIENINNVLDNEKTYYLASGECIKLLEGHSVIFEVRDLKTASPATISRCGVIYIDASIVSWKYILQSWISCCTLDLIHNYHDYIGDLLHWLIDASLDFLQTHCIQLCYPGYTNQVKTMTKLLEMFLREALSREEDMKNILSWIQASLVLSGIWGLAGILDVPSRNKFDEFYKLLWRGQNKDYPYPKCLEKLDISIPQEGIIYDYNYIYKQRGNWKLWVDIVKTKKIKGSDYMINFVVPTIDSVRYKHILDLHIKHKHNILMIGPSGTGKTLVAEDILVNHIDRQIYETTRLAFNIHITANQVQHIILSKLNKRKQGMYTPSQDKHLLIFLEDLNILSKDSAGISPVSELLRQHLDHNVWYDLSNFTQIHLNDIHFIAKSDLPEGYKQELCTRLLSHFSVFSINNFSEDTITKIYSTILQYYWKKSGFPSDIVGIVTQMTQATLYIFQEVNKHLKPNINQTHYLFNLKDFSRIIKGCAFFKKESHDSNKKLYMKLWTHEVLRVIGDRLNDLEDEKWLLNNIKNCYQEYFDDEFADSEIVFWHFPDSEKYEDVATMQNLMETVNIQVNDYNNSNKIKLDIKIFEESFIRLSKLCRIIKCAPGNALLLGVGGSSRQTLTKLACFINNMKMMQPNITSQYTLQSWDDEVKQILKESGGYGNHVVFLLREQDIVDNRFLININYLFKGSEIPTLYTSDEKQEILELVRLSAQDGNRNVDISSDSVFLFFHKRCLLNLHIILSLSCLSKHLSHHLSMYPYLLNSHVIWWTDWSDQYLEDVATMYIKDINIKDDIKDRFSKICLHFHRDIQYKSLLSLRHKRKLHITTSHYAHMIKLFVELTNKKQKDLSDTKQRYTLGLSKLSYAADQILNMQKSLADYQPLLEEMTQQAMHMTKQIALETIEVEKASALVRTDEKVAHHQAEIAQVLKSECEAELAQAIPILEDAISALNTLKPSDITLVKSMKNPPDAIKLVMAAVCVIKDVRPDRIPDPSTGRKTLDYWGPSKRILGDMNFLQTLKEFDKDNIKPEIMFKIRKDYLPHKDFKPHVVAKASSAAEGLCKWIIAMDMYDKVAKEVAPKKEKLEKAEKEYATTMAILNEKKEEVARIEGKLASLNKLLGEARDKQQKLQIEVDICKRKLKKAQKLIGGLSGEKIRWTEISEKLQNHFDCLTGDILLSSAFVAYLPGFVKQERGLIIVDWHKFVLNFNVPANEEFCFPEIIGADLEIEKWLTMGLPDDSIFIENALILGTSKFYPLFIDPQYVAFKWIHEKEGQNGCVVVKLTEDYFKVITDGVVFGRTVIIKDIGRSLPHCLLSLFKKYVYDGLYIINGLEYKLHRNFRFYMFSNEHNPQYPPEIWNKLSVINFHITKRALSNYLLNIVVEIERPEFKKLNKDLSRQLRKNKSEIKHLEEKILFTLTESDTDILEDEGSIKILHESKELAHTIRNKQEKTKNLRQPIIDFQRDYRPVADHACSLYFCINDLHHINYMYQFSLSWYIDLYFESILRSGISRCIVTRRRNLMETFTYYLYLNASDALYNKDKIILAFMMTCRILLNKGVIKVRDYVFFICSTCEVDLHEKNPVPNDLDDVIWSNVCHLEILDQFVGLKEDLASNIIYWSNFLTCDSPFTLTLPGHWDRKLSSFHRLILVNCLRPDRVYSCISEFVSFELGEKFINPLEFNINSVYNKSFSLQPVIFILTPGYNPMNDMNILIKQKNYLNKFTTISVGSKDYNSLTNLFQLGKTNGSWIYLQNCHFAKDWLVKLESEIENMNYQNTHENFRLWLSLEPYQGIPKTLLENSIKIINEPPQSLREKLIKLYKEDPIIDESFYRGCPGKHATFARLLYGLAFFHSSIQERQKMYSLDTPYLFNDKDFIVSVQQLQSIINETNFSFGKLVYVIGNCNYGGYIKSEYGKELTKVLLSDCLNPDIVKNNLFLFNDVLNYGLPNKNDHQDYMKYIERLPGSDTPEIFGLHPNSDVRKGIQYKNEFLTSLFAAARLNQRNAIDENETLIFCMVGDLLNNLPNYLNLHELHVSKDDSRYFVWCNEILLYNRILRSVKQSLNGIKGVLEGFSTINSELSDVMDDLLKNIIPKQWLSGTEDKYDNNLTVFIDTLTQNVKYFATLIINNGLLEEHKFSAYFNPKGLLTGLKLNYSRKYKSPLEDITLDYPVIKTDNVEDCIKITSLYLTNASWNIECSKLEDNTSKKLYSFMPPIIFKPVLKSQIADLNKFKCQLFNRDIRRGSVFEKDVNYIISVLLGSDQSRSYWMKKGAALYCEINM